MKKKRYLIFIFGSLGKLTTFNFLNGLEDFLDAIVTVQTDFHFHNLMTHKKNI